MPISDDEGMALYEAYMANNDFGMFGLRGDPRFARFQRLSISVGPFSPEFSAKAASPARQKDRQRW
jgi:hypothetical protein